MIELEIYETGKKFQIKDSWNELNSDEFIYLSDLLYRMFEGILTLPDVQTLLFYKLTGFEMCNKNYTEHDKEQIFSNVAYLATKLNFFYHIQPNSEGILQIKFNFNFDKFFIDKIKIGHKSIDCVYFKVISGMPETNLTAEAFVDAYNLYTLYDDKKEIIFLKKLAIIFLQKKISETDLLSFSNLYAFYIQFSFLMSYLADRSGYSILFHRNFEHEENKIRIGLADTLYSLSKVGYGSLKELCNLNLFEYLDLLLKETIDMVKQLNEIEKSFDEIQKITGLSYEKIQQII